MKTLHQNFFDHYTRQSQKTVLIVDEILSVFDAKCFGEAICR